MGGVALTAFVMASLVLAVTPGPGVVYIVARTLAQGRRAGFASVAGVACGNGLNAVGASLGLAALLAISPWVFRAVQFAGAAYLVWLGLKAFRSAAPAATNDTLVPPVAVPRLFRDGAIVALLNPKTALFFAAFLPQFMDAARPALPQAIGLGLLFVLIAACTDAMYVGVASRLAPRLARRQGARASARYATAAVFIALGLASAFTGQRQGH